MAAIQVLQESLSYDSSQFFATTTGDSSIYTTAVGPCIAGIFYRPQHLGLGHFNPNMESVLDNIFSLVKPSMERYGTGDIRCALLTGYSFFTRKEYQGERGIARYKADRASLEEMGFGYDVENSKTYVLTNAALTQLIEKLEVRLAGDNLDRVNVKINYFLIGEEETRKNEDLLEEFEIDMKTAETTMIRKLLPPPIPSPLADLISDPF